MYCLMSFIIISSLKVMWHWFLQAGGFCLKNGLVEALVNKNGHITELYVKGSKR